MNSRNIVLLLALFAVFAGCLGIGGGGHETSLVTGSKTSGFEQGAPSAPAPAAPNLPSNLVDQTGRLVIKQGSLELEVPQGTLEAKLAEFKSLVASEKGVVYSSRFYESSGRKSYSLTVKLPPASFESFPEKVKKLGKLSSFDSSVQDVTNQWVDLDVRIRNLEIERDRLLVLYNRTGNVSEILDIERELTRVQSEIEYNTAQKIQLERQIELATLDVTISEEAPLIDQTLLIPLSGLVSIFLGGLGIGLALLFGAAGFIIPVIILLLVLFGIYKLYRKFFTKSKK